MNSESPTRAANPSMSPVASMTMHCLCQLPHLDSKRVGFTSAKCVTLHPRGRICVEYREPRSRSRFGQDPLERAFLVFAVGDWAIREQARWNICLASLHLAD